MNKTTYERTDDSSISSDLTRETTASEMRYRRLFESSYDGILILDAATRKIIDVNPHMINLLGYSRDEFIGKELWELGLLKDEEASKAAFTQLQESGYIRYGDLRLETDLGRRCEVEFISNVYDEGDRQAIQCNIRDITGRKAAENKMESLADDLEEVAEDYRRVLDNSLDVICQIDSDGRFIKVSPAAKRVWGYEPEELIGTTYWDMAHPDDRIKTHHAAANTLAGKPTSTFENRTIRKDGSVASMMWSGNWSETHQIMYCVARDVSEIRLAETALDESDANYRALIESLPAIVCLSQPFQPYASIYVSPNAEAFGYSVEEWAGRPDMWISLIHEDDRERVLLEATEEMESGTETDLEYRMVTHDGRVRWMRDQGQLIPNPEGVVNGWQRVITDVTKRQLAEAELSKSREHMERAQKVAKLGSWEMDLSTRDLIWSPETYRIFENDAGSSRPTYRGFLGLVHPNDRSAVAKAVVDSTAEQSRSSIKHRLLMPDGRIKFIDERWEILRGPNNEPVTAVGTCQDITRRTLAEASQRAAEERLRLLFEQMKDGFYYSTPNGQLLDINPAMVEMFGYSSREEMLKVDVAQELFFSPEERKSRTLDDGWDGSDVYQMRRKDGSPIWVEDRGQYKYDEEGKIDFHQGLLRDVTERKLAEEELIQSEQRYRDLVENAYDMIYTRDMDGNFTSINAAGEKLIGYSREEFLQLNMSQIVVPEDLGRAKDLIAGQLTGTEGATYEMDSLAKDGRRLTLEVNTTLMYRDGVAVGVQGIGRDITERKKAEEAHSRLVAMLESSPDFAGYADVKTSQILYINKGGRRLLGFGEDEDVTQLSVSDMHPAWTLEILRDTIIPTVKREGAWSGECSFLHRDGRELPGLMAMVAFKSSAGEVEIISMMSHDITERNRLEDQLRQAQKMEAVGQMAGGIAHDFNNMLTAINGYSDLTLRQMKADDPLRRNIQEVKKAGERSAELTNQLLAFSRQQILQPEVVHINRIITETSALLKRMIGEDIELVTVLNPKTGRIKADPGQLVQIIMNLAVNARDAMPRGGKLTFETTNIYLDKEYSNHHVCVLPGAYVKLTVSDNGTGMEAKTKLHIFEPFFTTKAAGEGTGLGLAMVYGIVKQSNGHIMIYSEPGMGTTFTIYLPRVMDPLEEIESITPDHELPRGSETILVVEDEEIVRKLTRQVLEMCGYTVLEATNGKDALAICENHPERIDLLMTDVVMPEMGGRELAEKVSLSYPQMLVLFTSGYTDDAIVRHGVISSASSFIQKPFTTEALAQKVKDLFEKIEKL